MPTPEPTKRPHCGRFFRRLALAGLLCAAWPTEALAGSAAADAADAPDAQAAPPAAEAAAASGNALLGEVHGNEPVVVRLGQRLRCPVCQGMSIGDSPAPMAQDMMHQVRRMRAAGRSEAEIVAYFTARYGDWVLLDPPKYGAGLWVWLLPPAALLAGLTLAFCGLRRRVSGTQGAGQGPAPVHNAPTAPQPPTDADLLAIRQEVDL